MPEIAADYVARRKTGALLVDRGVAGLIAEAAMAIDIGRRFTMRAAALLDRGDFARKEVSMAKYTSPIRYTVPSIRRSSCAARAAIRGIRRSNGCIVTRGKRASSVAPQKFTRWF